MANAANVIQYRISRPAVRRTGSVIIVQRPTPFSMRDAIPKPLNQPVSPRKPTISHFQHTPRINLVPPARLQTRPSSPSIQIRRPSIINVPRSHRSGALTHVAHERNQMFASYKASIMGLKGAGQGRILVIIGNGPSHTEAPLERLKGQAKIDIMSINKPDRRVWPTRFWCFVDQNQADRHRDLWNGYSGTLINSGSVRDRKSGQIIIRNVAGSGFSKDMVAGFHIGRSSVYSAMQVAYWMDFAKVYIFGCDMCAVGGKLYPWGTNPDVDDRNRASRFEKEAESYMFAARHLSDAERSRYVFCSSHNPWPFMQSFTRLDQKTAVDTILEVASHF